MRWLGNNYQCECVSVKLCRCLLFFAPKLDGTTCTGRFSHKMLNMLFFLIKSCSITVKVNWYIKWSLIITTISSYYLCSISPQWFALRFPENEIYFDTIRELYKALTIYNVVYYLVAFFDGVPDFDNRMAMKSEIKLPHPLCFLKKVPNKR